MFIADEKARNPETLKEFYKAWNKVPYVGSCIGCYYKVEGHEDWCENKKVEFTDKSEQPIKTKKELDDAIANIIEQQVHRSEAAGLEKKRKTSNKEQASDLGLD